MLRCICRPSSCCSNRSLKTAWRLNTARLTLHAWCIIHIHLWIKRSPAFFPCLFVCCVFVFVAYTLWKGICDSLLGRACASDKLLSSKKKRTDCFFFIRKNEKDCWHRLETKTRFHQVPNCITIAMTTALSVGRKSGASAKPAVEIKRSVISIR